MKRVSIVQAAIALWFGAVGCWGGTIGWMGDYDRALMRARRTQKPLFVVMVQPSCQACRELIARMMENEKIASILSTKTVAVIVTAGRRNYPVELLYTQRYPTLFLLSYDEIFLREPLDGVPDLSVLLGWLEKEAFDER